MSANKKLMGDIDEAEDLRIPVPSHITNGATKRETAAEAAARIRAERANGARERRLDGFNLKLQVYGEVPGFKLAIMNDYRNRIMEAMMHGWDKVHRDEIQGVNANVASYNTDPGGLVRFLAGTADNGEPMYAYLMKLPEEIWNEDQREREKFNQRNDAMILKGRAPGEKENPEDAGTTYVGAATRMTTKFGS